MNRLDGKPDKEWLRRKKAQAMEHAKQSFPDDPAAQRRYAKAFVRISIENKPLVDALKRSSMITAADLAITINAT